MIEIISFLKENNQLNEKVSKYTALINEDLVSQGIMIFVHFRGREIKVIIPAPHHESLFMLDSPPTYNQILTHRHAIFLK